MKTYLSVGFLAATVLVPSMAWADAKAECMNAVSEGQHSRDAHKLVEAREHFRVCAAAACPSVVQGDCATWLADVEKALPTVVVTAKNASGADLINVKVSVDGHLLASSIDGRAVPIDAGPHIFHFESSDGATADQQMLVREGEKSQSIVGTLSASASSVQLATSTPPVSQNPATALNAAPPAESSRPLGGQKIAGLVVGLAGVVGLGIGSAFGLMSIGDHGTAHNGCPPNGPGGTYTVGVAGCTQQAANDWGAARTAGNISTVAFIAGGVAVAAGATIWFTTKETKGGSSTAQVGFGVGTIQLRGSF